MRRRNRMQEPTNVSSAKVIQKQARHQASELNTPCVDYLRDQAGLALFFTLRDDTFWDRPLQLRFSGSFCNFVIPRTELSPGSKWRTNVVIKAEFWKDSFPPLWLAMLPAPDRNDGRRPFLPARIDQTCCQPAKQPLRIEFRLATSQSIPSVAS